MSNPRLMRTNRYELFEENLLNREISRTKLLEKSMREHGFDPGFPLRCVKQDGNLVITHGHHRFHVARKLGIWVWYIVSNVNVELFESEASTYSWSVKDFAKARSRSGDVDVEAVMQYHEETGIPLGMSISLVGGEGAASSNKAIDLKKGTYKVGDMIMANRMKKIVMECKEIGIPFVSGSSFVSAMSKCLLVEEFDDEVFMHKVRAHSGLMEFRRNQEDYLSLIELVYNRQSQEKIPLAFKAREASRNNCAVLAKK